MSRRWRCRCRRSRRRGRSGLDDEDPLAADDPAALAEDQLDERGVLVEPLRQLPRPLAGLDAGEPRPPPLGLRDDLLCDRDDVARRAAPSGRRSARRADRPRRSRRSPRPRSARPGRSSFPPGRRAPPRSPGPGPGPRRARRGAPPGPSGVSRSRASESISTTRGATPGAAGELEVALAAAGAEGRGDRVGRGEQQRRWCRCRGGRARRRRRRARIAPSARSSSAGSSSGTVAGQQGDALVSVREGGRDAEAGRLRVPGVVGIVDPLGLVGPRRRPRRRLAGDDDQALEPVAADERGEDVGEHRRGERLPGLLGHGAAEPLLGGSEALHRQYRGRSHRAQLRSERAKSTTSRATSARRALPSISVGRRVVGTPGGSGAGSSASTTRASITPLVGGRDAGDRRLQADGGDELLGRALDHLAGDERADRDDGRVALR